VVSRLADKMPRVTADSLQLQQVVLNLLVNAVEAMDGVADRPRELTIASAADEEDQALVEVRDTGVGLAGTNADRLFQSFYTTRAEGMGMGLAISRSIIAAHGGQLSAAPNEPHGAVFRLTLPINGSGARPGRAAPP
jgi:signal transduction histidine kinase